MTICKIYIQLYSCELKFHFSLAQKTFMTTILDLYKETQGELKPAKSKLPYGIIILGKIHLSILFLPEVD